MTTTISAMEQYQRDGFFLAPPVIPQELIERVIPRMDAVIAGEYETGRGPHARHFPDDAPPEKLRKIDQPHLCDRTIREVIAHPELGRWAAEITGARRIQAWAVQLLVKPPGGTKAGTVGIHQDRQYWSYWNDPQHVFTAWLAISDVRIESGPMIFARGSHRWGFLNQGDFFGEDVDAQRAEIAIPEGAVWEEVPAILPPGAVSFHHALTFHGSRPNMSDTPRRSFAVHLRTEGAHPVTPSGSDPDYYITRLNDEYEAPVLYEA